MIEDTVLSRILVGTFMTMLSAPIALMFGLGQAMPVWMVFAGIFLFYQLMFWTEQKVGGWY